MADRSQRTTRPGAPARSLRRLGLVLCLALSAGAITNVLLLATLPFAVDVDDALREPLGSDVNEAGFSEIAERRIAFGYESIEWQLTRRFLGVSTPSPRARMPGWFPADAALEEAFGDLDWRRRFVALGWPFVAVHGEAPVVAFDWAAGGWTAAREAQGAFAVALDVERPPPRWRVFPWRPVPRGLLGNTLVFASAWGVVIGAVTVLRAARRIRRGAVEPRARSLASRVGTALIVGFVVTVLTVVGLSWFVSPHAPRTGGDAATIDGVRHVASREVALGTWSLRLSGATVDPLANDEVGAWLDALPWWFDGALVPDDVGSSPAWIRRFEARGFPLPATWGESGTALLSSTVFPLVTGSLPPRGAFTLDPDPWPTSGAPGPDARVLPVRPIWTGLAIDVVVWALAWLALVALRRAVRALRFARRGRCPGCGYPRVDDQSGACPECGLRLAPDGLEAARAMRRGNAIAAGG